MKRVLIIVTAAVAAHGAWVYEGQWGSYGTGNGEFNQPCGVTLAGSGYIYVAELVGNRIQYFSAPNVYQGQWPCPNAYCCSFGPNGYLYVTNYSTSQVLYYTSTGSLVGSWSGSFIYTGGVDCAANGDVYVTDLGNDCVKYFTSTGSAYGSFGSGYLDMPVGLELAPSGNVYVAGHLSNNVAYFTPSGSLLGSWSSFNPGDVGISPVDNTVFVSYVGGDLIYYYTSTGSLLGSFGSSGTGNGEFDYPSGIIVAGDGGRVYVGDRDNHRVQYFKDTEHAVAPASLGKVKALFR
jgi:tripartite motif-containing protein 71